MRRNSSEVLHERAQFVRWYKLLSEDEKNCIVWVDEQWFNLWTVTHRARSLQGIKASIPVPTTKGKNVTIILAVSIFGKVSMLVSFFTNS